MCTFPLQRTSKGLDRRNKNKRLGIKNNTLRSSQGGSNLVDTKPRKYKWKIFPEHKNKYQNNNRCIKNRLGGSMPREDCPRPLDKFPIKNANKPAGTPSCIKWNKSFDKIKERGSCPTDGQHCSSELHQENGGYEKQIDDKNCPGAIPLVQREGDHTYAKPHPRRGELGSRPGIQDNEIRQKRLDAKSKNIPNNTRDDRTTRNRSICLPMEPPTNKILFMETPTAFSGTRCPELSMERRQKLCIPPIHTDKQSYKQNKGRKSDSHPNNSSLAHCNLVWKLVPIEFPASHPTAKIRGPTKRCKGSDPPSDPRQYAPSRLEFVRRKIKMHGVSNEVADIITKKNRATTEASYQHAWSKWSGWCAQRQTHVFPGDLNKVSEYFLHLFNQGMQVSSIEVHRSALSATLPRIDGLTIGNHPIIIELFQGFANLKPRQYKSTPKWSIDQVLDKLMSWGKNQDLSLRLLTKKLAMLLALSSASRCSELAYLETSNMKILPDGIKFTLTRHKKNRNSSIMPGLVFFPIYKNNSDLCPVECLKCYIQRTRHLRSKENRLFRGLIKPYAPISPATVSRYLTQVIVLSGGPHLKEHCRLGHSVRSLATSKGKNKGLSTADILRAGEWKHESVFSNHYYHQEFLPQFGNTVLGL